MTLHPTLRRIGLALTALLVVLLLLGVTYQGIATAFERRDYPAPGHLVDVGGHQLHVHCTGKGRLAVVLEAPEAGFSSSWGLVQPALAHHTRVCSYDRAGLGWSESGDGAFDAAQAPVELRAALAGEHVAPPYVLVGQSMGAALARLYTTQFPADVLGLVLVDEPADVAVDDPAISVLRRDLRVAPWLARTGLLRLSRLFSRTRDDLPPADAGAVGSFLLRPDHLTRAGRELNRWSSTLTLAGARTLPATVAVTRVATGHPAQGAALSRRVDADRVVAATMALVDSLRSR